MLKKAKDAVNKAKETVKSVVKKTTTTAKQTVQKAQQTVTKVAISTKNAVVNAANEYKENWNSGISQLKSSGTAGKLFASYSEGLGGNISNTASTLVQFVKDPLGTASECVDFFLQDPLRNNPVAAVGRYYNDIAQASYVGDWETVANRVGSGTVTVLEFAAVDYAYKGVKTLKNKYDSKMSVKTTAVTNDIKTVNTASRSGIKTQNRYALTGSEHYENLKSVFGADNVKWEAEPDFGNKLDYLFGKAKGNQHNLERTAGMKNELEIKMGISDNNANRSFIKQKIKESYFNDASIANTEPMSYIAKELPGKPIVNLTGVTRETFIMGPDRGAVFQTLWDDNVLKNIIVRGGKGTRPETINEILSQINRKK